jgi:hypothetical protein
MSIAAMRPTFEMQLEVPCHEVDHRIREVLGRPEWSQHNLAFENYSELHIPQSELRYWSPHLSLLLSERDGGTHVFARFAPRQEVWTLVWVIYLALAFTAFFAAIFAYSQWILRQSSWVGAIPVLACVGIALLHIASRVGQTLSSDQMHALRERCDLLMSLVLAEGWRIDESTDPEVKRSPAASGASLESASPE